MRIKICGITKLEQGQTIASLGATDLGFICVAASPRYVTLEHLKNLVPSLAAIINCVGVFADASISEVIATVAATGFGSVQLHGQETLEYCRELQEKLRDIEIIKAWRVKGNEDLKAIANYSSIVDTLLLDAYHPQALGGTGQTLDWQQLLDFQPTVPWFLAGGLNPLNISAALAQLRPDGIDLSSGVEISPGYKDLEKVRQLFSNQLVGDSSPSSTVGFSQFKSSCF